MSEQFAVAEQGPIFQTNPTVYVKQATRLATELAAVINAQKLFAVISNRKYVTVEAWTLLANMLGVHPIVVWSRRIDQGEETEGWEARVEVRNGRGDLIGAGEAMCTRQELVWGGGMKDGKVYPPRDDFALRAMAQTRAISRALRNPLGFVVKLAGYEATPAEEMPANA